MVIPSGKMRMGVCFLQPDGPPFPEEDKVTMMGAYSGEWVTDSEGNLLTLFKGFRKTEYANQFAGGNFFLSSGSMGKGVYAVSRPFNKVKGYNLRELDQFALDTAKFYSREFIPNSEGRILSFNLKRFPTVLQFSNLKEFGGWSFDLRKGYNHLTDLGEIALRRGICAYSCPADNFRDFWVILDPKVVKISLQ